MSIAFVWLPLLKNTTRGKIPSPTKSPKQPFKGPFKNSLQQTKNGLQPPLPATTKNVIPSFFRGAPLSFWPRGFVGPMSWARSAPLSATWTRRRRRGPGWGPWEVGRSWFNWLVGQTPNFLTTQGMCSDMKHAVLVSKNIYNATYSWSSLMKIAFMYILRHVNLFLYFRSVKMSHQTVRVTCYHFNLKYVSLPPFRCYLLPQRWHPLANQK